MKDQNGDKEELKVQNQQAIWIVMRQSGLKLKFDDLTQQLTQIEIYIEDLLEKDLYHGLKKNPSWMINGNLLGKRPILDHVEQLMYQPAKKPLICDTNPSLTKLTYNSGIKFIFQDEENEGQIVRGISKQYLRKIILTESVGDKKDIMNKFKISVELEKGVTISSSSVGEVEVPLGMHIQELLTTMGNPAKQHVPQNQA